MPLASIHLISLSSSTTIPSFLETLKSTAIKPLTISKVVRWVITPTKIDASTLLHPPKPWDLLLIVLGNDALPPSLQTQVACHWTATAGIPSRLTQDFARTNDKLLHPARSAIPPLTGSLDQPRVGATSQTLEASRELLSWAEGFAKTRAGGNPLSMLNLLAFKPGMKASYLRYGKAFGESIGVRRGGVAKLVGNMVTQTPREVSGGVWDEFALASYPSVLHFADMLASHDYQAVNLEHRVPALEDTLILCTSEIEVEDLLGGRRAMGKL